MIQAARFGSTAKDDGPVRHGLAIGPRQRAGAHIRARPGMPIPGHAPIRPRPMPPTFVLLASSDLGTFQAVGETDAGRVRGGRGGDAAKQGCRAGYAWNRERSERAPLRWRPRALRTCPAVTRNYRRFGQPDRNQAHSRPNWRISSNTPEPTRSSHHQASGAMARPGLGDTTISSRGPKWLAGTGQIVLICRGVWPRSPRGPAFGLPPISG